MVKFYVLFTADLLSLQAEDLLEELYKDVVLPQSWSIKFDSTGEHADIYKVGQHHTITSTSQPTAVTTCLSIYKDLSWRLYVHGKEVNAEVYAALECTPVRLSPISTVKLLSLIDGLNVCIGNPDPRFTQLCELQDGKIKAADGTTSSYIDDFFNITLDGQEYQSTVRSAKCSILTSNMRCKACRKYRATLRALCSRQQRTTVDMIAKRTETSSHTTYQNLTPEQSKQRMSNLKKELDNQRNKVYELEKKIQQMIEKNGQPVDPLLQDDLQRIMTANTNTVLRSHPEGSFHRLFWQQQLDALKATDKRQIRWHPALIRWCLHLKLISTSAYDSLRSTGVLTLPCERTLRDYTHWMEAGPGFIDKVDQHLMDVAKIQALPEFQKYVCLVMDEVKVKEDLVYDKNTAEIIGFTNLGYINNQLSELEWTEKGLQPTLATNMLVFMVRGLFLNLEYPYAQFPCTSLSGEELFPIVWQCIERLEACGFKVIAVTADGASCNRKFFRMHQSSDNDADDQEDDATEDESEDETFSDEFKVTYKTTNIYSPDKRPLYFISDVPHLIKTVRNCWSNSFAHSRSRTLRVSI